MLKPALAILLLAALGCGPSQPPSAAPPPPAAVGNPADVVWNLEKNGLRYRLEAAPDLNLAEGRPLGLTVRVYQLSDGTAFSNLAATAAGLDALLSGGAEVAGSVSDRVFQLQPGTSLTVTADRQEGARYLAVAAGYAHMRPNLCTALLPFPVHQGQEGLIRRHKVYTAGGLEAAISLGPESVTISGVERVR